MKVSTLISRSNAVAIAIMDSPVPTDASHDAMDDFCNAIEAEFTLEDHQRMILNLIGALSLRDIQACQKVEETLHLHSHLVDLVAVAQGLSNDPE